MSPTPATKANQTPNTASVTQPMNQGIIQVLKLKLRKKQPSSVLQKLESNKEMTGPDLLKATNVLQTIYWVEQSWREVDSTTIQKCFKKCGVGADVAAEEEGENKAAEDGALESACCKALNISLQELSLREDRLATTDNNPVSSMADLQQRLHDNEDLESDWKEENHNNEEPGYSTVVNNFEQLAAMLTDLRNFAVMKGCGNLVDACMDMEEKVAAESLRRRHAASQSSILNFFKKV
ncbi:uncharacterized protein LOC110981599 [Acanthaster planci]|uniref:Uncharacterized protein LOC110981599 n=1 Tax=Acanthaster planci TaxID=133434 RepID=A0A8B7YR89_ACAPL|nr:uncharacterized protein LOC110981599 [Acanthaster planci]